MTAFDLIIAGYRMGCQSVHRMCADLTPGEFQYQPISGTNSAAWIVGHLALSLKRAGERAGATGMPEVSEEFSARFKTTRHAAGNQLDLGSKEELLGLLDATNEKLMEAFKHLPPEALVGPPPNPAPAVVTNSAEMFLFGTLHIMLHCGQISTIRRSLGKPPLV